MKINNTEYTEDVSEKQKDMELYSYKMEFHKYHEIAEKLGLPLGTVKSRIFFARQRLQNILKDYR